MSNLLMVLRLNPSKKNPLLMEFPVQPETAPYLVSSTQSVLWVPVSMEPTPALWEGQAIPPHVVRVAVRKDVTRDLGGFFWDVTQAVEKFGREHQWGNVHGFTEEGIAAAVEHVGSYDLGDLCMLIPRNESSLPLKDIAIDLRCLPQPCTWVPQDTVIVVPKNREYVGFLGLLGKQGSMGLVHNAARAIGIARGSAT